jgi:hypothetical protein
MAPLVINENHQFVEESFKDFLMTTCRQHKLKGRVLAFSFIIYDFDNHTITYILEEKRQGTFLDFDFSTN